MIYGRGTSTAALIERLHAAGTIDKAERDRLMSEERDDEPCCGGLKSHAPECPNLRNERAMRSLALVIAGAVPRHVVLMPDEVREVARRVLARHPDAWGDVGPPTCANCGVLHAKNWCPMRQRRERDQQDSEPSKASPGSPGAPRRESPKTAGQGPGSREGDGSGEVAPPTSSWLTDPAQPPESVPSGATSDAWESVAQPGVVCDCACGPDYQDEWCHQHGRLDELADELANFRAEKRERDARVNRGVGESVAPTRLTADERKVMADFRAWQADQSATCSECGVAPAVPRHCGPCGDKADIALDRAPDPATPTPSPDRCGVEWETPNATSVCDMPRGHDDDHSCDHPQYKVVLRALS